MSGIEEAIRQAQLGHEQEADRLFRSARRDPATAGRAWAWLSHASASRQRWAEALRRADAAIAAGDPPWWVHHVRGEALTRLGDPASGLPALRRAAAAQPGSLEVACAEVWAATAAGDVEAAHRAAERALRIDPTEPRALRAAALADLAAGRGAAAESRLRSILHDGDIEAETLNNLAIAVALVSGESEARPLFAEAHRLAQTSAYYRIVMRNRNLATRRTEPPRSARLRLTGLGRGALATQSRVLLFALAAFVGYCLIRGAPAVAAAVGVIWLLINGAMAWRGLPEGRYRALPAHARLTVTVPSAPPSLRGQAGSRTTLSASRDSKRL